MTYKCGCGGISMLIILMQKGCFLGNYFFLDCSEMSLKFYDLQLSSSK
jgi:hypothetical protein